MEIHREKTAALEVRHLSFSYGKNTVLNDINIKIPEGKITTVMGANGCGKSTLFYLLTRNLPADQSKLYLQGKVFQTFSGREFARHISIVQQTNRANDDIRVEELVALGRTPHRKMFRGQSSEDERMIEWAMDVTGITELREREIGRLSGGQRQRVWIAMALAQNTKILLLDEPTTYLDIRYQIEILELVRKLNQEFGITILMVLHDINQAIYYSDQIIGMRDGRIEISGSPDDVIDEQSMTRLYGVELKIATLDGKKFVLTNGRKKNEVQSD